MKTDTELTEQQLECLHRVFAFLIQLADETDAAAGDEFADPTQTAAEVAPAGDAERITESTSETNLTQAEAMNRER